MGLRAHFGRFLIVGSINTALDIVLYFAFANLLDFHPVPASILSTGLTMCVSFFLNHKFVFRSNKRKRHTLAQFVGVTLFNVWVVQSSVIYLALHTLDNIRYFSDHIWTLNMLAKFCGIAVSFILNFIMYRYIFHQERPEEA